MGRIETITCDEVGCLEDIFANGGYILTTKYTISGDKAANRDPGYQHSTGYYCEKHIENGILAHFNLFPHAVLIRFSVRRMMGKNG